MIIIYYAHSKKNHNLKNEIIIINYKYILKSQIFKTILLHANGG